METKQLTTWEDFETQISEVFSAVRVARRDPTTYISDPLFRGHAFDSWTLSTTLERFSPRQYTVLEYYERLKAVQPAVLTFSSSAPSLSDWEESRVTLPNPPPGYEFMIYLRHHGFPSPLLDWTRSPYVAAFFAFEKAQRPSGNVAIFVFREYVVGGKGGLVDAPTIIGLGPYVVAHPRHHIQQCEYTICKKKVSGRFVYCDHEEAIVDGQTEQDVLVKYLIPVRERDKVLERLYLMNISAYSLFANEEALMTTLAYKEIERRETGTD